MIEMDIKEKALIILSSLSNDDGEFGYWEPLMENFIEDPDYETIKNKMNNLVNKLNELKQQDENKLNEYLNKDFETEVWDEI